MWLFVLALTQNVENCLVLTKLFLTLVVMIRPMQVGILWTDHAFLCFVGFLSCGKNYQKTGLPKDSTQDFRATLYIDFL